MVSDEPRFKHVGLSSDSAVIFCELDNGKTYSLPIFALSRAQDWAPEAKASAVEIVHDGCAAVVEFDNGIQIDFPSHLVLQFCEPAYGWHKGKRRAKSGVGARVREIREARDLTLDQLAVKCGIAKPNLSRLEHDKVTPGFATIRRIAAALETHPALLFATGPGDAWKLTLHIFTEWKRTLRWDTSIPAVPVVCVAPNEIVDVFLANRPEHCYARRRLLNYVDPNGKNLPSHSLDLEKWERELAMANWTGPT
jgi:transcriptional regulator with XRE-family HTH domain